MARAGSGSDFPIEVVLDHDDFLASIWVGLEYALNRGVGGLALSSSDVPCVADHEFEVIVSIDAGAEILVVVLKLLNGDDLVTLVRFPHGHEVGEHLIGRLFTALEVGVEAHIIGHSDVINGHLTAAILIKDAVSLVDHIETASVELTSDSAQKFVEGKLSVLVAVEVLHNLCHLDLR